VKDSWIWKGVEQFLADSALHEMIRDLGESCDNLLYHLGTPFFKPKNHLEILKKGFPSGIVSSVVFGIIFCAPS
jgi:hypothetical protein